MRNWIVIAAVAAQVLVLAWMAGQREWIARTGETVLVRTAPIDPRDPMRGDYVRLSYEISTVPRELCRDGVATWFDQDRPYARRSMRDRRVYAVLEREPHGVHAVVALTDRKPAGGVFLRGRTDGVDAHAVRVRYGIEAFFMEQGTALEFEREMRGEKDGVPVNAEIAIGRGGLAVLRSCHWEPLGITLGFEREQVETREATTGDLRRAALVGLKVTLKNHGDTPLAIVDLPEGGSFRMLAVHRWGTNRVVPVARPAPRPPRARDVVLLQPGQEHTAEFDLRRSEWFVDYQKPGDDPPERVSIASLRGVWDAWLRVEYNPPAPEACVGLPHADAIRHAPLRSRAFSPAGAVD